MVIYGCDFKVSIPVDIATGVVGELSHSFGISQKKDMPKSIVLLRFSFCYFFNLRLPQVANIKTRFQDLRPLLFCFPSSFFQDSTCGSRQSHIPNLVFTIFFLQPVFPVLCSILFCCDLHGRHKSKFPGHAAATSRNFHILHDFLFFNMF